jgi:DNA adenine methylase
MSGFFRYPGGKSKLSKIILDRLVSKNSKIYVEPFFGGGSVGLSLMPHLPEGHGIWINDRDPGIAAIWTTVIRRPDLLKRFVDEFVPSVDSFYALKDELVKIDKLPDSDESIADLAIKKLSIHQMSYSGLGTKAGGPIGGVSQSSNYGVDCRWSPKYINKKIDKLSNLFNRFKIHENSCTCEDFSGLISSPIDGILLYLDPPYYEKGNALYQCAFTDEDHNRLANSLKQTKHLWVLSYDNCTQIKDLYSWAHLEEIAVNYTISTSRNKSELLIEPKD